MSNIYSSLDIESTGNSGSSSSSSASSEQNEPEGGIDDWFDSEDLDIMEDFAEFQGMIDDVVVVDFEGDDVVDLLNVLGDIDDAASNTDTYHRQMLPEHDIIPFQIEKRKSFKYFEYIDGQLSIYASSKKVYLSSNGKTFVVGKSKMDFRPMQIERGDYLSLAEKLSEEASTKGTCLGFSSLIHSTACLIISQLDGVLEPIEGFDVIRSGVSFEITGRQYKIRESSARAICDKYRLVMHVCEMSPKLEFYLKYSFKEDDFDTSLFSTSSLAQPISPYTNVVDRYMSIIKDYPRTFYDGLAKQYSSWYSRQQPSTRPKFTYKDVSPQITELVIKYSKSIFNQNLLPAPFRILGGKFIDPSTMYSIKISPYRGLSSRGSTFHVYPYNYDPEPIMMGHTESEMTPPEFVNDNIMTYISNYLMRHDIYKTIIIESELLSKIHGLQGQHYSRHSRSGISWFRTKSGSLTYYAAYHQIGKPPISCGIWTCIDKDLDLWQSATFKISSSDISYAKVLPLRFNSMIASVFAYTNRKDRKFVIQKLLLMIGFCKWSTWQTSAIMGDSRFFVLCAISGSGDVSTMISKAADRVKKYLSFPDYYCLFLLSRFSRTYDGKPLKFTPLYKLPMKFLTIEKDIPLMMMWHIRGKKHATDCFKKLAEGVKFEITNREEILKFMNQQLKLAERAPHTGITQQEFDNMMSHHPQAPYFNFFVFAALSWKSANSLQAGKRQNPTKIKLANLVSDHHSTIISNSEEPLGAIIDSTRVAEGFSKLLKDYDNPRGIHELIHRLSQGPKLSNVFTIHPKDSKSKNREIPQMTNYMRVTQFVSESLLEIYTDDEEADMMQNPSKYSIYAKRFSDIMSKRGRTRSEDKSFFCGHMHPEFMSVAIGLLARILGSTPLVLSSSLIRCDRSRITVTPHEMDEETLIDVPTLGVINLRIGKKLVQRKAILNYVHMQQGVRAMAAACINTAVSTGLDLLQREVAPDIIDSCVLTTSDDAVRGVVVKAQSVMNRFRVKDDYINAPINVMPMVMMLDSTDKGIESERIAEFNNVVCSPVGLMPQHFVHAHLAIQPLNGENIIDDIFEVTARARSTLSWGDTFDLTRSVLSNNILYLCQKWHLTDHEIEVLISHGLLPETDEELLRGGKDLSDKILSFMLRSMLPASRTDLENGLIDIRSGLRSYNVKEKSRNKYIKTIDYPSEIKSLTRNFVKINASRRLKGNLKVDMMKPYNFERLRNVKNDFLKDFYLNDAPMTEAELILVKSLPQLPKVKVYPKEPSKTDLQPHTQGGRAITQHDLDYKLIIAKRETGVTVTRFLTDKESDLLALTDKEFERELHLKEIRDKYYGIRFKSPTGRPLIRFYGDAMYIRPQVFTFIVDLPYPEPRDNLFTMSGRPFRNFKPCWWGEWSLLRADKTKASMAFGYSIEEDALYVFYKLESRALKLYTIETYDKSIKFVEFQIQGRNVLCPIARDYTPIKVSRIEDYENISSYANMTGDATALLNYGNYMNSDSATASKWMKEIFKAHNSSLPGFINDFKPRFPIFAPGAKEFEFAKLIVLKHYNSITRLKLIWSDHPRKKITIDLQQKEPIETFEVDEDVDADFDD